MVGRVTRNRGKLFLGLKTYGKSHSLALFVLKFVVVELIFAWCLKAKLKPCECEIIPYLERGIFWQI